MPKESDSSEDFDPVKIHFEKCCSGLAFLYLWTFSMYQIAQEGGEVQRLLFSDLLRLLHQRYTAQSIIKAACWRYTFCQNHLLFELSGKSILKNLFETFIYFCMYLYVFCIYS